MSLKCQIIPYKDKTDWVLVVTFGFIIILLMMLGGAIYGLSEAYFKEHPTLSDMRPYVRGAAWQHATPLTNYGLYMSASGGQVNTNIIYMDNDTYLNAHGEGTYIGPANGTLDTTLGALSTYGVGHVR